ncbi:hypothetical protein [Mucilaginibacter sp.]|jgi:hypothetical protein|uniref:hypothetical protein n=1 Tax=Mucilaginibacter sp. TaxID=1882438 RepID=UPI002CBE4AF1|nr:hypothetical protein [Mucilaginibacter sp.]HTI58979.1 hypothetical protein [Mucilaginibacter sp.]
MGFWETSGFNYHTFADLPERKLIVLINAMTREDIIEWLIWNDPNGIYHDEHSLKELGNILTRSEGIEILLRQIEENRVT